MNTPIIDAFYQIDDVSPYKSSGKNKRKITFIVHQTDYAAHNELIEKIIGAVGLDLENDILMCKIEGDKVRIMPSSIAKESPTDHFFTFGFDQHELYMQTDLILHQPFVSENYILHASFALEELANDVGKKKTLWGYLKQIFK